MLRLSPEILLRKEIDGTGVLFDPISNKVFSLNKITVAICELLQEGTELENIMDMLKNKCQSLPDNARNDVTTFLATLEEKNYLGKSK